MQRTLKLIVFLLGAAVLAGCATGRTPGAKPAGFYTHPAKVKKAAAVVPAPVADPPPVTSVGDQTHAKKKKRKWLPF